MGRLAVWGEGGLVGEGAEVVGGELEVVGSLGGQGGVHLHGLAQVVEHHRLVVCAGAEDGLEVECHGVGRVDAVEDVAGLGVVLCENHGHGGVVALDVSEGVGGCGVIALEEVVGAEGFAEVLCVAGLAEELVGALIVAGVHGDEGEVHVGLGIVLDLLRLLKRLFGLLDVAHAVLHLAEVVPYAIVVGVYG